MSKIVHSALKRAFVLFGLVLMTTFQVFATEAINTFEKGGGYFSDPPRSANQVAIRGYDTVAYFDSTNEKGQILKGHAVPGLDQFKFNYKSAVWRFSSQKNLDLFKSNPEKYVPQYGGYCAYGVAKGSLVKIEPDQFTVVDGKLYLNYDSDVNKDWLKDKEGYIKKADAKFTDLLKK